MEVIFDSKLQWADHLAHAITRSMRTLNAIKLIWKFFNQSELLMLVTSNFYSILFYNSEIWHVPTLKSSLKQKFLSTSAKALRVCNSYTNYDISFNNLHKMCRRATPNQMLKHKLALYLFKIYNTDFNSVEFWNLTLTRS